MNESLQLGMDSLMRAASSKRELIRRMVPLAQKLARVCGSEGVTVCDLREAAVAAGLLTGREVGRQLSFLGAVMRAAGLRATLEYRRSTIPASHGNLHRVFRA